MFLLIWSFCVVFTHAGYNQLTSLAAEHSKTESTETVSASFSISPLELKQSSDDYYSFQMEVPAFDRAVLFWTSQENPVFSLRVMNPATKEWDDWQSISENGQPYLRNIGGLFHFNFFQPDTSSLFVEIRAEKNSEAGLTDIQLTLSSETPQTTSTIVMIIVMLAAGMVFYIKKASGTGINMDYKGSFTTSFVVHTIIFSNKFRQTLLCSTHQSKIKYLHLFLKFINRRRFNSQFQPLL